MAVEVVNYERKLGDFDEPTARSIAALINIQESQNLQRDEECPDWSSMYELEKLNERSRYIGRVHISGPYIYLEERDITTNQSMDPRIWQYEKRLDSETNGDAYFLKIIKNTEDETAKDGNEPQESAAPLLQEGGKVSDRDQQFDFAKPIEPYSKVDERVRRIVIFPNENSGGLINQVAIDELTEEIRKVKDENHDLAGKRLRDSRAILVTREKPLRDEELAEALKSNEKALQENERPVIIVPLSENEDLTGFNLEDAEDRATYEALLQQRARKEKLAKLLEEVDAEDERLSLGDFNEDKQNIEIEEDDQDEEIEIDERLATLQSIFGMRKQERDTDDNDEDDKPEEINEIEEINNRIKDLIDKDLNRNPRITKLVNGVIEGITSEDGLVSVLNIGESFSETGDVRGITRLDLVHRLANLDFSEFRGLRGQYFVQAMLMEIVLEQTLEVQRVSLEGGTLNTRVYVVLPFKVDSSEVQEALKHPNAKTIFPKILDLIERQKPKAEPKRSWFGQRRN